MSWFSSTFHSITGVVQTAASQTGGLFSGSSALVRALANPGDAVAVGQVFDNTAVKRQTPGEQLKNADNTVSPTVHKVAYWHEELARSIGDGAVWVYHAVIDLWHGIWYNIRNIWRQIGGEKHFDQLGKSIGHTVDKWGGERRVVGWVIVVVVVIVWIVLEIFSWGGLTAATPFFLALISYGLSQGLTPDDIKNKMQSLFGGNTDNSKITSISSESSSSSGGGQTGSFFDSLLNALGDLPPIAIVGASVAAFAGVYYLATR